MKTIPTITFLAAAALAATSAEAAIFSLPGTSLAPDGTGATSTEYTDLTVPGLNNGVALPTGSGSQTVFVVTTFTFGTGSDAHLQFNFNLDAPGDASDRGRIGLQINDTGTTTWANTGATTVFGGTTPGRIDFNFGGDMAGQTVTILAKFNHDANNSVTYDPWIGANPNAGLDTLANAWFNPTVSAVEGSGISAGDIYAIWDGQNLKGFKETVFNQNTPGTAGDSFISNTRIFTGADATFANALAFATIPEPSTALLGGLGFLALLRRRR